MKKLVAFTVCALLGGAALAYNVGDRLHGFEVKSVTPLPEVKGTLVRMTYLKNGADLAWLDREDDNMTFAIAFNTIPQDDTGVAHIMEHSVLCGSEKYPVKELFVSLKKSSFATYLNATTMAECTIFPICSRNRKDFLNLMDVYLDTVFHPLCMKSPLHFRQEGWHWELDGADGELKRNGVVFSEMKGAFSGHGYHLYYGLMRLLFPDNTYGFVSGGDPDRIPDLTFEKFKEFYERHYHPSNARIFLDGSVDLPAALAKIDTFLSPYPRRDPIARVPFQKAVSGEKTFPYEIAPGADPANKTIVAEGWVFAPWTDRERGLAFDVLSEALTDSNEAPLSKALLSRGLCDDVSLYAGDTEQRTAKFVAKNVVDGKEKEVRRLMRETIESLAKNGLDHARLAAVMDRMEFHVREQDNGKRRPLGLSNFRKAIDAWTYGGDPALAFQNAELFASLRKKLKTDWFENFLREALLDNPHHALVTMTPSPTLAAERAAAEKRKLAAIKAGWSKEELEAVLASCKELAAHQNRPNTPEDLSKMPRLALSDVPLRGPEKRQKIVRSKEADCPILLPHTAANGITYVELYFQLHGLTREELLDVSTLAYVLCELATEKYPALALRSELDANLGRFSTSTCALATEDGKATAYFVISANALSEKRDEIIRLLPEIMQRTKFDDVKAVGKLLRQRRRAKERETTGTDTRDYAARRAMASVTERGVRAEMLYGIEQIRHLQKLDNSFESGGSAFCQRLEALCAKVFRKERLALCCMVDNTPAEWLDGVLRVIPSGGAKGEYAPYGLYPKVAEGFRTSGKVAFAAKAFRHGPYRGDEVVAARVLTLDYLWDQIRVRGGAYGSSFFTYQDGECRYLSWNDPKPGRTLGCYDKSGDALRAFVKGGTPLDSFIVSAIAQTEPYMMPRAETARAAARYLQGLTPEDAQRLRAEMLRTTKDDLLRFADKLDALSPGASICVIGGGDAFNASTNILQRVESIQ